MLRKMFSTGNQSENPAVNDRSIEGRSFLFLAMLLLAVCLGGQFFINDRQPQGSTLVAAAKNSQDSQTPSKPAEFRRNELLVKAKPGELNKLKPKLEKLKNQKVKTVKSATTPEINGQQPADTGDELSRWLIVTLDTPATISQAKFDRAQQTFENKEELKELNQLVAELKKQSGIETIEPNYLVKADLEPNDPYYNSLGSWGQSYFDLWGLRQINTAGAWDLQTGSNSVTVAVIDSGIDQAHPDIAANLWVNQDEIAGNFIDDDANGYTDDRNGWDFVQYDGNPQDDYGHGTHVAGTIGAIGNNNLGVVGVSWQSQIMNIRFLDNLGYGSNMAGSQAIRYAADNGAKIASNSWGCNCQSTLIDDAISYAESKNMLVVAAAGNDGNDALDYSPAGAEQAVTVGASDTTDTLASFSNRGAKLDVAAPGVDILSLKATNDTICPTAKTVGTIYCRLSGTSMATPHVSGLAALLLSQQPNLSLTSLRYWLRQGAVDLGLPGRDLVYGYGRINAFNSLNTLSELGLEAKISSPKTRTSLTTGATTIAIQGTAAGTNFASYILELGKSRTQDGWQTLTSSTTAVTNGQLGSFSLNDLDDGLYSLKLSMTNLAGQTAVYQSYDLVIDNFENQLDTPFTILPRGQVDLFGSALTKNGYTFGHYEIAWGEGSNPSSWSTAGLTLVNSGSQTVNDAQLASFDTSNLTAGQEYTVRLTVFRTVGSPSISTTTFTVDADLLSGWPKRLNANLSAADYGLLMAGLVDLNDDDQLEIILGGDKLRAFYRDGSPVPGFSVTPLANHYFIQPVVSADLNNDGSPEILATATRTDVYASRLYILNADGTPYAGWTSPNLTGSSYDHTPTVGDLNNDGTPELVIFTGSYLNAYKLDGTQLAGWPKQVLGSFGSEFNVSRPTLVDLNNDGNLEIAYSFYDNFSSPRATVVLRDNLGNLLPGWPATLNQSGVTSLATMTPVSAGDINGDGQKELFVMADNNSATAGQLFADIYGFNYNGSILASWPRRVGDMSLDTSGNGPRQTLSLADLDNDGADELIAAADKLTIHDAAGVRFSETGSDLSTTSPAITDIDGDSQLEIVSTGRNTVRVYDKNGVIKWQKTLAANRQPTAWPALVTDLNNDGQTEIVLTTQRYSTTTPPNNSDIDTWIWQIPNTTGKTQQSWPMYMANAAKTGRLNRNLDLLRPKISLTNPLANQEVSGQVTVTTNAWDSYAVAKVEFFLDSNKIGESLSAPFSFDLDTTTLTNGAHQLFVKATDTSGNWQTSTPVSFTINNDLIAPTVNILAPSNGQTVSGTVLIEAQANDNVGVTRVEFYADGALIATDTSAPYSTDWATSGLVQGQSYTLTAKAFDAKGNQGVSTPISVTIADTTAPQVSLTAPLAGATVSGQVTINASASDNLGLNRVEFYVDNALIATDTTSAYSATWDTTGLAHNSAHLLKAIAFDNAGNQTTSAEISVTVADITLPSLAITNPLNNAIVTRGSLVTIRANSSDISGITKVEFRVNNTLLCTDTVASGQSYDCNWRVPTKRNILYTIQARSYDTAGNITNQSIQVRSN